MNLEPQSRPVITTYTYSTRVDRRFSSGDTICNSGSTEEGPTQ
jgi:hypothetical protein